MLSHKVVLVTGAAGFIGFHSSKALVKRGDQVIGCDIFNDYYDPKLKEARSEELRKQNIPVLKLDICSPELKSVVEEYKVTHILHLAAQAGVRYSLEHPDLYIRSNIQGFLSVLETAKLFPGIKVVYASSSSVYGRNTQLPYSTEDRTDTQANLYGVTKKSNELMADAYHHLYRIDLTGLRYFTVYGPWGRPDMAYYSFTQHLLEGVPIKLFNEGKMSRDFTYIDDIVEGTLKALDFCKGHNIYNLGNHNPSSLKDFIHILEDATGKKAQLQLLPMQKGDMKETFADIEKTKNELAWEPKISLKEGLSHFVEWFLDYTNRG